MTLKSPQVSQPGISISYLAPSYGSADSEHTYALQILDEILSGGATSRLYRGLVVEQAVAASAGSGYRATAYDLGTFDFHASPRPGGDINELEAALRAEIARLLEGGVTEAEVAAAKRRLRAAAIFARDSLGTGPNIFGRALTTGQSVADVESWPERIEAVTVEQVDAAAHAVFLDNRSVTGLLLPAESG